MMKKLFAAYKKEFIILMGLIICVLCYWLNPFKINHNPCLVLSLAAMMIFWWVFDALPMPIVALMPIVLFPIFGISNTLEVTKCYADSIVFLFMGGLFLGIAVEKWSLHKRIALSIIKITGTNGNKIIIGFIIATGFLSMWLSNTATTMMMFPIATSVISLMENNYADHHQTKNFSIALMLCIAYASNFALGTIIGTPPNVAYVNYISDKFKYNIGFTNWMILFTPLSILLLFILYWIVVKWLYPNHIKRSETGKTFISTELNQLGKISKPEIRVFICFAVTVLFWIFKDFINHLQNYFTIDDTTIAITGAIALFIIPSGEMQNGSRSFLLEWDDAQKMSWGILLLFGGGIALAKQLEKVGLMEMLGRFLGGYASDNTFIIIVMITTASVFLSEVMSNLAQVIIMAPVVSSVAISLNLDPLLLGIPMTLGASCASMLPMGTPSNAIVFASGQFKMKEMIKTGFILNLICIVLISLFCYFLQPLIMKLT